jgi:pyridoxamine 5'-phosphate oxidase-like protein
MVTTTSPTDASVDSPGVDSAVLGMHGDEHAARVTREEIWRALARASFAVVSYVTPAGAPRSSGVVYGTVGRRLYVAVAPDSWKARHIALSGQVAVTVPVRRGGILSLLLPIPPATISFHAKATVHPPGSLDIHALSKQLELLVPADRRASAAFIEIVPEDRFLTYGLGVSLRQMANPVAARARVPVSGFVGGVS